MRCFTRAADKVSDIVPLYWTLYQQHASVGSYLHCRANVISIREEITSFNSVIDTLLGMTPQTT